MKILGRQLLFGDPKLVDIVIFDECNSGYVREALPSDNVIGIFNMRPEDILIGPKVFIAGVRCLSQFSALEAASHSRGFLRGILSQLRCIYFEACLLVMRPKAVVTFIDNSGNFHWLSRKCKNFPFIAIQNGSRLRYASVGVSNYYLQHLFCWGAHEAEFFPQIGYQVENYYPVGSLVASLTLNQLRGVESNTLDLLIVSTWRGRMGFPPDVVDTMRSMRIMDELLAEYVTQRTVRAAVILRSERDSEHWIMDGIGSEYDYYRSIYGDAIEIIEADFTARTIYPTMMRSQLVVSCLSSALIEAYGMGKKVLYCNFTGTNIYHCDVDSSIVTSDSERQKFFQRLDDLRAQPLGDYLHFHKDDMLKMMSYPDDCSTFDSISRSIEKIIVEFKKQHVMIN